MSAMLPFWILGAPLVFAIINRFMTPSVNSGDTASSAGAGRSAAAPSVRR